MNTSVTGFRLLDGSDRATAHARDQAPADPGALSVSQLERWLDEIRNQPSWRREADKACDYYDGNQLDAETLARLDEKGLGPLVTRDPALADGSPSGAADVDLLAYMLGRAVDRVEALAGIADRARIAGLTCERAYDEMP